MKAALLGIIIGFGVGTTLALVGFIAEAWVKARFGV